MLLELFDSLRSWGERFSRSTAITLSAGFLFGGLVIILLFIFAFTGVSTQISTSIGSLIGLGWLVAVNFIYWFIISDELREKLDYREKMNLSSRRWASGIMLALWFGFVLAVNSVAGEKLYMLLGALTVTVLVSIARFFVATPEERQAWSDEQEAKLRIRMYEKAYREGLIDENGNLVDSFVELPEEEIDPAEVEALRRQLAELKRRDKMKKNKTSKFNPFSK